MTNPNETLIVCLLDRTGSMQRIVSDTCGAFDTFIAEQRDLNSDDRVLVSLYQFDYNYGDDIVETVYERKPVSAVPPLTLKPRGGTPLNDALGDTITLVGMQLNAVDEDKRPGKVIFVIMTDGEENASHKFTNEQVKALVNHQRDTYSWEFVFLGAGIDAFAVGAGYGFHRGQTFSVAATGEGIRSAYAGATQVVSNLRTDRSGDVVDGVGDQ